MRRRLTGRRPPVLALGTIAVSTMMLSGCGDDPGDSQVMFTSVDQCVSAGMDQQVCQAAYQDAMRAHLATAPRFDGMAACEAEFGSGKCAEEPKSTVTNNTSATGSFFMPFLSGYLLSSALNNIGDYYTYRRRQEESGGSVYVGGGSTPIYRNRSGELVTTVRSGKGDSVAPVRQTVKPVNVNTRTVARQGFGGRSSFSFGG